MLREIAKRLSDLGFNVVPIKFDGENKRPCCVRSWSAEQRVEVSGDAWEKADAVAITGTYWSADSEWAPVPIDIDNLDIAGEVFTEALGEGWLERLCGRPWSFCGFSGPRCPADGDKHHIRCEEADGDYVCIHAPPGGEPHLFKQSEAKRGMYIVVRVPRKCLGRSTVRWTGVIELMVRSYQVVAGRHYSGVPYQPARYINGKWTFGSSPLAYLGPGETLSCDEWGRLVREVTRREDRKDSGGGKYDDETYELPLAERELAGDPDALIDWLKKLWPLVGPGGGHYHDFLTFAIASLARRAGVKKEEVYRIFDPVFDWAVAQGHDTQSDVNHHRSVIEWVYKAGEGKRIWGRKRFEEIAKLIFEEQKLDKNALREFISTVYAVLNVKTERPLCVPITSVRERSKSTMTEWICNTEDGIVAMTKKSVVDKEALKECVESGGDKEECRKSATENIYVNKKLVNVYILSASVYRDAVLGISYVSATWRIVTQNTTDSISMQRVDAFVERLKYHRVRHGVNWTPILDAFPVVEDIIASGFACPPPEYGLPCRVRDYFGAGIDRDPDPARAREAWELLDAVLYQYRPSDEWHRVMLYAIAQSAFANFALTRKLWRVRPAMVALVGPRHTGKTTTLRIVKNMFFPLLRDVDVIRGASSSLTAARIGRLQSAVVTTWLGLDEVDAIVRHEDALSVLKSHVTSLEAWRTANGELYPAYAGLTLTANRLEFIDPELADKVVVVEMTEKTPKEKEAEFSRAFLEVAPRLVEFGAYYLKYAEKNWESIKDIVLGNPPERAAVNYINTVLQSLGIGSAVDPPPEGSGEIVARPSELLYRWLHRVADDHITVCRGSTGSIMDMPDCVEYLITSEYIPHIKEYNDNYYIIRRSISSELPVNLAALCEELGGEIYSRSHNSKYYGACVVPKERIRDLLSEGS
jgi:hypothetical protein